LPLAKRIRIKRITHQTENFSSRITNIKQNKFKPSDKLLIKKLSPHVPVKGLNNSMINENNRKSFIKFFSLNELFFIENLPLNHLCLNILNDFECFLAPFVIRDLDLLKGIYKNYYIIYKIEEVEYEEYERLNEFLKEEKLYQTFSSLNKKSFINGFYIDVDTEVEFIKEKENPSITILI